MKRLMLPLLTAVLTLSLTACSPKAKVAPFPPDLPRQLLETEVFSEPLEPLEEELVWIFYGLEDAGLVREQLTDASAFRSTGATCEELALLTFADETAARTATNILQFYVSTQIETNKDYRPGELPKLRQAVLEHRSNTVLLMVANDYEAADGLLAS